MEKILVSACLLGQPVKYNGTSLALDGHLLKTWQDGGWIVPLCPEIAAGFPTPRPPAEIENGKEGRDVLSGDASVSEVTGHDVTARILRGAELALEVARTKKSRFALLTDGSPSCGSTFIYDGTFSGAPRKGLGVVATLLAENGIRVFSQHRISALASAFR